MHKRVFWQLFLYWIFWPSLKSVHQDFLSHEPNALWQSFNGRCNIHICLSFFPRPNISDRFVSLASHFIRVQIFQIPLWGTKWMVVIQSIKSYKEIENMESENEFINWIFGRPAASKKSEIFVKHFFRLWIKFSPTRGCFSQMFKKQIS